MSIFFYEGKKGGAKLTRELRYHDQQRNAKELIGGMDIIEMAGVSVHAFSNISRGYSPP